ncbi:hypothetical protein [Microbispora sp. NBRC 16548]|uniref:hypothetical protein n=1 Tax=Microbispora sp. NBRC 16548 TaxID=3030994 RepID=UPI001620626C|nr:hypothetical protein [Microbispora sp. NBRC 16548]GLX06625.1 hypothetical protein Misp03_35520 [Microbispora sp. NBRC 16548]
MTSIAEWIKYLFDTRPDPATGRPWKPRHVYNRTGIAESTARRMIEGGATNPTWDTLEALETIFPNARADYLRLHGASAPPDDLGRGDSQDSTDEQSSPNRIEVLVTRAMQDLDPANQDKIVTFVNFVLNQNGLPPVEAPPSAGDSRP